MLKYVFSNTQEAVQVSLSGSMPYRSGAVYWDHYSNQFKVVDAQGGVEVVSGQSISVSAGGELQNIMAWCRQKMAEEAELKALCRQYPNLDDARREFETLRNIVKDRA